MFHSTYHIPCTLIGMCWGQCHPGKPGQGQPLPQNASTIQTTCDRSDCRMESFAHLWHRNSVKWTKQYVPTSCWWLHCVLFYLDSLLCYWRMLYIICYYQKIFVYISYKDWMNRISWLNYEHRKFYPHCGMFYWKEGNN